jgi:hypothetical protein
MTTLKSVVNRPGAVTIADHGRDHKLTSMADQIGLVVISDSE